MLTSGLPSLLFALRLSRLARFVLLLWDSRTAAAKRELKGRALLFWLATVCLLLTFKWRFVAQFANIGDQLLSL